MMCTWLVVGDGVDRAHSVFYTPWGGGVHTKHSFVQCPNPCHMCVDKIRHMAGTWLAQHIEPVRSRASEAVAEHRRRCPRVSSIPLLRKWRSSKVGWHRFQFGRDLPQPLVIQSWSWSTRPGTSSHLENLRLRWQTGGGSEVLAPFPTVYTQTYEEHHTRGGRVCPPLHPRVSHS